MNYEMMATFVSLSKTRSFTKTASEVFCTQSTATLRIQNLESFFGVKLFHRQGKTVSLTEAGEILLPRAELILSTFREVHERISQLKNLSSGKVDIISSHTPGTYLLPRMLASFRAAHPFIVLNSNIQYASTVIREIAEGAEFDLGLVSQPESVDDPRLSCRFLMEDPLTLITWPDHPLANTARADLDSLEKESFLISNGASSLIDYLMSVSEGKVKLGGVIVVGNAEAVKKSVKMKLGVSILSRFAVQEEVAKGELAEIALSGLDLRRGIFLLERKTKTQSPASEGFKRLLFESLAGSNERIPIV